jgi:hypothetical protein
MLLYKGALLPRAAQKPATIQLTHENGWVKVREKLPPQLVASRERPWPPATVVGSPPKSDVPCNENFDPEKSHFMKRTRCC